MARRGRGRGPSETENDTGFDLGLNVWAKLAECRPWPGTPSLSEACRAGAELTVGGAFPGVVAPVWLPGGGLGVVGRATHGPLPMRLGGQSQPAGACAGCRHRPGEPAGSGGARAGVARERPSLGPAPGPPCPPRHPPRTAGAAATAHAPSRQPTVRGAAQAAPSPAPPLACQCAKSRLSVPPRRLAPRRARRALTPGRARRRVLPFAGPPAVLQRTSYTNGSLPSGTTTACPCFSTARRKNLPGSTIATW